jgi:hypothetical protein
LPAIVLNLILTAPVYALVRRLRAAFRRDWAGYLAIAMIVGLVGGVAMASVAAARRTQSAFPRILAASNASDLHVDPGPYSARVVDQISHLPRVRSAESASSHGASAPAFPTWCAIHLRYAKAAGAASARPSPACG